MKSARVLASIVAGSLFAGAASAEWSGKGKIGGVIARGNTETATANVNLDVLNELERWNHKFGGSMLRTLADGLVSADRWELRAETDFRPTDRTFVFASTRYENDEFTDFAYQATAAIGYGYHFIATGVTKLDGRLGIGMRRTELRLANDMQADEILRFALEFERKLTDNTSIINRLLAESGQTNTFVQNQLAIEVKMTEALALGLSYDVRYNTDVLPGTQKADQVFTAGLVVGF